MADASVAGAKDLKGVAANMNGAFEIEADVTPDANGIAGIEISNNKRERTMIYFDMKQGMVDCKKARQLAERLEAFRIWTGHQLPTEPMAQALRKCLENQ